MSKGFSLAELAAEIRRYLPAKGLYAMDVDRRRVVGQRRWGLLQSATEDARGSRHRLVLAGHPACLSTTCRANGGDDTDIVPQERQELRMARPVTAPLIRSHTSLTNRLARINATSSGLATPPNAAAVPNAH